MAPVEQVVSTAVMMVGTFPATYPGGSVALPPTGFVSPQGAQQLQPQGTVVMYAVPVGQQGFLMLCQQAAMGHQMPCQQAAMAHQSPVVLTGSAPYLMSGVHLANPQPVGLNACSKGLSEHVSQNEAQELGSPSPSQPSTPSSTCSQWSPQFSGQPAVLSCQPATPSTTCSQWSPQFSSQPATPSTTCNQWSPQFSSRPSTPSSTCSQWSPQFFGRPTTPSSTCRQWSPQFSSRPPAPSSTCSQSSPQLPDIGPHIQLEQERRNEEDKLLNRLPRPPPSPSKKSPEPAAHSACSGGKKALFKEPLSGALQAGGKERDRAVALLRGTMLKRCLHKDGCRDVQIALGELDRRISAELLSELTGHVLTLVRSPFGNYVVQRVIEVMPPAELAFIVKELKGSAVTVARHPYGCRVLLRLLEHFTDDLAGLAEVVDEVLTEAAGLCRHPYAHHVIETTAYHGLPRHRHLVCKALRTDLMHFASDRHASFVVEAALTSCCPTDQQELADKLMGMGAAGLSALVKTHYGMHVVRALLQCPVAQVVAGEGMTSLGTVLQSTKYGRRLLQKVGTPSNAGTVVDTIAA